SENISFMRKTIGIQALFDLLKAIVSDIKNKNNIISFNEISTYLCKIDIQNLKDLNVNYSGIGRSQIRDYLKKECGIV
ncbi:DNA phosphorothioation-associated DGQHR protein 1, partial [Escherichia coli]|nr:DNA phosphorothioation-associated DGQHR protein 1 [Escherichia coli]